MLTQSIFTKKPYTHVCSCVCVGLCVQLSQCCYLTALVLVSGPSLGVEISLSHTHTHTHTHTRTSSPINHKGRGYVGGRGNWGGCPTTMYLHTHTRAYIYTFFPHLPLSPTIFSTTIPPAFPPNTQKKRVGQPGVNMLHILKHM